MQARPFLRWPYPRLKTPAAPVEAVDDHIHALWDEMIAAMRAMHGVGLAALQLGEMLRVAVVDASGGAEPVVRMANPVLLEASAETSEHDEGSPNLPGLWAKVTRPARVRLGYLDETGEEAERWFEGLWAASAQHQLDHLEGRMFFDRLKPVKRRMLLDKARKLERREKG
jgi:peptide deformylase